MARRTIHALRDSSQAAYCGGGRFARRDGFYHQFLPPDIQPLQTDMIVLGRALPVLEQDLPVPKMAAEAIQTRRPLGLMLEALDDLKPGEVYFCTGSSPIYATWEELMSTRAMQLGATGTVLNRYSRDTRAF